MQHMFQDRSLIIATKHHKESVIAPLLEKELGVKCFTDPRFDTDTLGTFTGEVERTLDPIATAREKCLQAMIANQCDLGVASEGSFGPHPSVFFIPADDEFLIFIDRLNQVEIIVRELSTDTNFNGATIETEEELNDFARKAGFPSHGLILRPSKESFQDMHKGITNPQQLTTIFHQLKISYGKVYAETDMRALYNPTRMQVIKKTAQKLVEKIKSKCPECAMPGFGVTEVKEGLPCSLCGWPTRSTLSHIYECQRCHYTREVLHPYNKTTEEPGFCDRCNP